MPTNQIAAQNIEDLRAEVRQAKQREQDLAREASDLPHRIKEAARQVVREKASSARAGGELLAVASEVDVSEMRSRQDNIGYELWAAKLHRAELAAQLGEVEEQAARQEVPDAEGKHRAAEAAVVDAQAAERDAYLTVWSAYGRVDIARKAKNDARSEIEALEAKYPGM